MYCLLTVYQGTQCILTSPADYRLSGTAVWGCLSPQCGHEQPCQCMRTGTDSPEPVTVNWAAGSSTVGCHSHTSLRHHMCSLIVMSATARLMTEANHIRSGSFIPYCRKQKLVLIWLSQGTFNLRSAGAAQRHRHYILVLFWSWSSWPINSIHILAHLPYYSKPCLWLFYKIRPKTGKN